MVLTILKNMKVNGKEYPIYEMENKLHVWDHQPDIILSLHSQTLHLQFPQPEHSKTYPGATAPQSRRAASISAPYSVPAEPYNMESCVASSCFRVVFLHDITWYNMI